MEVKFMSCKLGLMLICSSTNTLKDVLGQS